MTDTLWPHGLQHTRLPCPSLSPRVCSNSCPLSWWCYLILCHPLLLLTWSFLKSWLFTWCGQSIWSFSISPSNEYSISFRIDWLDLLAVQGTLKRLLQHQDLKASVLWCSAFFMVQFSHVHMTTGKPQLWLYGPLSAKWCLCFVIHCLEILSHKKE